MGYFTTTQLFLDIPTRLDVKESQKINKFLTLFDDSKVGENISKYIKNNTKKGDRPNVNYYRLFATTLYSFAFSKATLRQIEGLCKFDLRCKYLMRKEMSTFSTICKFIDKVIYSEREDLFSKIIKCICVYGDLKQNYSFTRFRRRGMEETISEIMIHLLGYAIRKLFRFFETDKKCNFWSAPSDL